MSRYNTQVLSNIRMLCRMQNIDEKVLYRGICLHLQRPPKIESLANFEPIGRCKIPMKMLMKRDTR